MMKMVEAEKVMEILAPGLYMDNLLQLVDWTIFHLKKITIMPPMIMAIEVLGMERKRIPCMGGGLEVQMMIKMLFQLR